MALFYSGRIFDGVVSALCTLLLWLVLEQLIQFGSFGRLFALTGFCFVLIVFSSVATAYGAYIAPVENKRTPGLLITFALAVLVILSLFGNMSKVYTAAAIFSTLCSLITAFCLKPVKGADFYFLFKPKKGEGFHLFSNAIKEMSASVSEDQKKKANKIFFQVYGWYFALGMIAALTAPDDILSSYPFLAEYFVDPIAILTESFLDIPKWAAYSRFPEVTRFTFALLAFAFPATVVLYCYKGSSVAKKQKIQKQGFEFTPTWKVYFGMIIFCLLPLFTTFFPAFLIDSYATDFNKKGLFSLMVNFAETSRLGLGIVSFVLLSAASFFLCLCLCLVLFSFLTMLFLKKAPDKI